MNRRDFLKISLTTLLIGVVKSNPVLATISNAVHQSPYKVFLYLIQTSDGKWKVKGTTCTNMDKVKLSPFKFNIDTFKPLGVYSSDESNDKKLEFWNKYNCGSGYQKVNYQIRINNGIKAKSSGQLKDAASKGGRIGGNKNKENKHGLFSLTHEQKSIIGTQGASISYPKMLQWCRDNNHWENIGNIHRGIRKSIEHKQKISKKLIGRKLSIETCKKMSESRMGMVFSDDRKEKIKNSARKRMRPVIQYDLESKFIKEWGGFAEIVDELNLEKGGIYLCCKGKINKSQGFIWKYKDEME
jgi:hypothetical protein